MRRRHGWVRLLGASLIGVFVWTVALPWIGNREGLRESIDRREALGINADAMFYTELEAMKTLVVPWKTNIAPRPQRHAGNEHI